MPANQIPVFVGVTGKRKFYKAPDAGEHQTAESKRIEKAENERLAAIATERIDRVLDRLDEELSDVTKILLTGGAYGADLIAARRVLGLDGAKPRRHWLAAVVLPFPKHLFREDFDDEAEWDLLEEVLADPRVRCIELPRLRTDLVPPPGLDPKIDPLFRANHDPEWQEFRRLHYEQVGLWIVDTANILLAVMPADEPAEKAGGTARVVACRRSGRPDDLARGVIETSYIPLAPRPDLVRPPQQYVWLIDPTAPVADARFPATVLPPLIDEQATRKAYERPGRGVEQGKRNAHLHDSLAAANTIERLGQSAVAIDAWPSETCPASVLQAIRSAQHPVRRHTQWMSRLAFTALSILFVLAVLAFEIFAKFFHDNAIALAVYVLLLFIVLGLYYVAKRQRWQPDAEDSRAVAELLRLQYAWWRAGLADRVDHWHLSGADQDLARVREAARNGIVWANLAAGERCADENWKEVWRPHDAGADRRRDWIGEQAEYFEAREKERETQARNSDVLSWMLFVTSFWLALDLAIFLGWNELRHILDSLTAPLAAGELWTLAAAAAVSFAAACAVWLFRACISETDTWQTILLTATLAFFSAAFLTLAARFAADLLIQWFSEYTADRRLTAETYTSYLMIVAIVVLPALAGAMRFRAEKYAHEAEALSYREALRWFQHADELLAEQPPGAGNKVADDRARAIVHGLGILALRENEAWLKSRRERPLTPVIGG